jgi:hypothetical protein
MKRTTFFKKETVDGIDELDYLYNNLSDFKMIYEPTYYRVTDSDVPDPALISFTAYGSVEFFWIILLVNDIEDPFSELVSGLLLTIPHKLDIYNFQKKFKVRR